MKTSSNLLFEEFKIYGLDRDIKDFSINVDGSVVSTKFEQKVLKKIIISIKFDFYKSN